MTGLWAGRGVMVPGALLVVALVAAYGSATRDPEVSSGEQVTLVEAKVGDLTSVKYEAEGLKLELSPRKDPLGAYFWVTGESSAAAASAVEKKGDGNPSDVSPRVAFAFKAGAPADRLLEGLLPLRVLRGLAREASVSLREYGLDPASRRLTLEVRGHGSKSYVLGDEVFGGRSRYLLDEAEQRVYLVDAKILRPLERGQQTLVERDTLGFPEKDLARLRLKTDRAEVELEHRDREDLEAASWVRVGAADAEASRTYQAWVGKLLRLRATAPLGPEESPVGPRTRLTIVAESGSGARVEWELLEADGPRVAPTGPAVPQEPAPSDGDETVWFVRSAHLRGTARVAGTLARELIDDLETVVPNPAAP